MSSCAKSAFLNARLLANAHLTTYRCLPTPTAPAYLLSSPSQLASPSPSTFVKRNGTRLELDGEDFKAVGPNIYWLGESAAFPKAAHC